MPLDEARLRDILRVLCRIPIERGQLVLYRLAVESPTAGFKSSRVRELLAMDQAQHRGVMAALTVRINHSPREQAPDRKPGLALLFHQKWDGTENTYRPREELLEAIQRVPALRAFLERPMEEVLVAGPIKVELPTGVELVPKPAAITGTTGQPPGKGPEPAKPAFPALLDAFEGAGLVYPAELVANVLLALQVKRFVILTGISGTGKTRIAQVLADQFSVRREVTLPADPGDDAALVTVMPYMRKYHRLILPAAVAAQLPGLPTEPGSYKLNARWPGGTIELSIYIRDAVQVLFRGALRQWFDATFAEGDTVVLRAHEDGATLVLDRPPKATVREERVANAEIVAVRPDWTDHRGLLGAYNPLTQRYLATPFLRLLLRADEEARKHPEAPAPFFLVLDEMNLARVEHYFADFLSALESGEPLHLHDSLAVEEGAADDALAVPRQLRVPPNVFFVGTVNVDESTYLFSPKVLDRAFTVELNAVDLDGLAAGLQRGGELDLGGWRGALLPPRRPGREDWTWLLSVEAGALVAELRAFHRLLAGYNRHFGYRVATEVARFVRLATEQATDPGDAAWAALDLALLQKVLVKLHGTRHELATVLDALLRFALVGVSGDPARGDPAGWVYRPEEAVVLPKDEAADVAAVFPRSAAKLWRMRDRLRETGFTSWIE